MKKIYVALTILLSILYCTTHAQVVTLLAGNSQGFSDTTNGIGTGAEFYRPSNLVFDGIGNLYVVDQFNNDIRKINIASGLVSTLAGGGHFSPGSADGIGTKATFNNPCGITTDGTNLYVTDENNNKIRQIVIATAVVTTLAGTGAFGSANGAGTAATFQDPMGITTDGNGNLFIADEESEQIRQIVIATGVVSTFAGSTAFGHVDSVGTAAVFYQPLGIVYDGIGNLYVTEGVNSDVRKIVLATSRVTTIAGPPTGSAGTGGMVNGIGSAARFYQPIGITTDRKGNLYIADQDNYLIRKLNIATNIVSTYAGHSKYGYINGVDTLASFNTPSGVCTDSSGNVYVADCNNNQIRKIAPLYPPNAGFMANTTGICSGQSVQFTDTSHNNPTSWHWTFQNGTPATSSLQNPLIVFNSAGTDSVTLVVWNIKGRDSITKKLYITVTATPASPTIGSNSPICSGATLNLTASNTGTTYSWTGPQGFTSSLQNPSVNGVVLANSGMYYVSATAAGCTGAKATASITIDSLPATPVTNNAVIICAGSTLNLKANSVRGTSYNWTGPSSFSDTLQNPSISNIQAADSGTYVVIASNICGSGPAGNVAVTVNTSVPSTPIIKTNTPVCAGSALTLSATASEATNYSWSGPTGYTDSIPNPTIPSANRTTQGTYSVTATNACGTGGVATVTVAINKGPKVNMNGSFLVCAGMKDTLSVSATGNGPFNYSWNTSSKNDTTMLSAGLLSKNKPNIVSLVAGTQSVWGGSADGTGTAATFYVPAGMVMDDSGYVYIADENNGSVRKLNPTTGVVSTIVSKTLVDPLGITTDNRGNLYVTENRGYRVQKIEIATGKQTVLAGNGVGGFVDGIGTAAEFYYPMGITTDNNGNLYVADSYNQRVRKIVIATGQVTTYAGNGVEAVVNGTASASSFIYPHALAFDHKGHLYIAEDYNIRELDTTTNTVSTLVGTNVQGSANGTLTQASFGGIEDMALDGADNIYVVDQSLDEIRKVIPSKNEVITIAGHPNPGTVNGADTAAAFYLPDGIMYDGKGNIYVSEADNNDIRKIALSDTFGVTVTDGNGCITSSVASVTAYPTTNTGISMTRTSMCVGDIDTLTAYGSQTYVWNTGATTSSILDGYGTTTSYTVIGNYGGCGYDTATATVIVNQPMDAYAIPIAPTCGALCNGYVTTYIYGGNPPFKYMWSTGATTDSIGGLCAGTYSLTIVDSGGCSGADTATGAIVLPSAQMGYDLTGYLEACIDTPSFNNASIEAAIFNNRCMPVNGTLKLVLDTAFHITNVSADTAAIVSGDTLMWNFNNLSDTSYGYGIVLNGTVSNIPAGDSVFVSYFVTPTVGDSAPWNNSATYWVKAFPYNCIGLPFDPNEKSVSPAGDIADTQKLTYTIHFQNTGTAIAHNIVVVDTLSTNLDPTTLKVISSSNAINTVIEGGHIVKFIFDNINLPDTGTSKTTSIGVFTYTIKPISNLKPGSKIINRAGIYFDANRPVFTNKTINTISAPTGIQTISAPFNMACFPNPFTTSTSVVFNTEGNHYLELYDVTGRNIESIQCTGRQYELQRGNLASGIYFLKSFNAAGSYVAVNKLVVQ